MRYAQELVFEEDEAKMRKRRPPEATAVEKEKQILKLAVAKGGTLSVAEVALGTSLSMSEAEELLSRLVEKGFVGVDVGASGTLVYEFHGILDPARFPAVAAAGQRQGAPQALGAAAEAAPLAGQIPDPAPVAAPVAPARPEGELVARGSGVTTARRPRWRVESRATEAAAEAAGEQAAVDSSASGQEPVQRPSGATTAPVPGWRRDDTSGPAPRRDAEDGGDASQS